MQPSFDREGFAARLRQRLAEIGYTELQLSRDSGLSKSSINRWTKGESVPNSEQLFPLSDTLRVRPRWLLYGDAGPAQADLLDVQNADWMAVPRYDLFRFTADGKGDAVESIPIRRDWLARAFRVTTGLWLTEMPSDAMPELAREGETIVCRDVEPREPDLIDGRVYIFMLDGSPIIRKLSIEPGKLVLSITDDPRPIVIDRRDPPHFGEGLVPIARVIGKFGLQVV
jgi:transcriptional regulator with XRE-family HTH domain